MAGLLNYIHILLAFLSTISIFHCWWKWNRRSIVINLPVVGMMPSLLCNSSRVHEYATYVLQRSRGTFVFEGPWFCGLDFVITSDPDNLRHILSDNFGNYHKGIDFKQILEPLGDGIFNSDGDWWKTQRRTIHSLMEHRKFQMSMERTIRTKICQGLFSVFDHVSNQGIEVDIQDVFQRFTFDNICLLMLGFDPNSLSIELPHVPYEKAFDDMEEAVFFRHILPLGLWKFQKWLQIGEEKKLKKAWEIFDGFLYNIISKKREQLMSGSKTQAEEGEDEYDLLRYFLVDGDYHEGGGEIKSDKFLRDTAFNLLAAGRDTIGAGLVWLFWLLATHPFVEKKILEEIKSKFGAELGDDKSSKCFRFEELDKLVYLHATICETLRLYRPVPFEHIVSIGPDILPCGLKVDKNTRILYSLYSMGRMEEIWGEDCLEFKPERWISEEGKIKYFSSYKFIAFNAGPRICLGKQFAFMQMKTVASSIIWNYSFQVVENHPVHPSASIILHMKNGLKARVFKRSSTEDALSCSLQCGLKDNI